MTHSSYLYIILLGMLMVQACKPGPSSEEVGQDQGIAKTKTIGDRGWLTDLNEAQAQSVKEQKPILVSFTASDTCRLCKALNANVFSSPTFKSWAEKSVVLLEVDMAQKNLLSENRDEQHLAMANSLKVNEYPTVWILKITHEPENDRFKVKPLGKIGYQETPEKFIGLLQNLTRK